MLAMDPCNRLSGERGFLVVVFFPSIFPRTVRLRSSAEECPFLISGISKHLAYGGCCPPPGTCLESPTLARAMGARASETHIIVDELEMLRSSPVILDTEPGVERW